MPFKVLPATLQDVDEIAKIRVECSTSPRILLETRNVKPEDYYAWHRAHAAAKLRISDPDSDVVSLKIVDEETGSIAAYCQWGLSSNAFMKDTRARKDISSPPGYDTRLWQRMAYETAAVAQRNPQEGDYYTLLDLLTAPTYRRRGLASILVKWGIERADNNQKTIILDASPSGFPLYKTLGFEEVDKLEIPLGEYGGEGSHVHVHMIRQPSV